MQNRERGREKEWNGEVKEKNREGRAEYKRREMEKGERRGGGE